MSPTVKVSRLAIEGTEIKEVDLEDAKKLIEEAYARGNFVLDKETGNVIEDIDPDVKEILVVGVLGGG